MSYYVVEPPRRRRIAWAVSLTAAFLVAGFALMAGWAAARPLTVLVDGTERYVQAGTTIEDLESAGVLKSPRGNLLSVSGQVVSSEAGNRPTVTCDGKPVQRSRRLYPGDVIESLPGTDRRESLLMTDVPMPFDTKFEGSGPLTEMRSLGSPGIRRVTRGAVSGVEVTSTVIKDPSPMVVRRVRPAGAKLVALTFDDGPSATGTERILRVLEKQDVRATFFMVGTLAKARPDLARRVVAAGHDVGTHTYSHKRLASLRFAQARREIVMGRRAVESVTGRPTPLVRPPYGALNDASWRAVRDAQAIAVLWDVDPRDWTKPGSRRIADHVISHVRPGSVVLLHDGGGDRLQTARSLSRIIRELRKRGYVFVTLTELSEAKAAAKKARSKETAERPGADHS